MPKRKTDDSEKSPPHVRFYYDEIDSMAFKTLSPNAAWLLLQYRRAWRGSNERIELPFARVSWKLTFYAFDKARRELVEAGFVRVVNPGRRSPGGLNPTVYALSEGWRGEVAKRLAKDDMAGYLKNVRAKDGRLVSVWYPARRPSESQENWKKAAAAMARKKAQKAGKKTTPAESKKIYQTPKVYLNRVRVAKLLEERGALKRSEN